MRETRSKNGKTIYYATRSELEGLPGYRGNDRRGRACCPIHNGDNPQALSIDWGTGWAHCFSCGDAFAIRVEDHPDTNAPAGPRAIIRHPGENAPQTRRNGPGSPQPPETTHNTLQDVRAGLERAIAAACDRLPGSPGAAYLAGRGLDLDIARELRIGWAASGPLAGRVVFPFTDLAGRPVGATGRAIADNVKPKYKALPREGGYQKLLFNGGAIAQARRSGHPVIICEGPVDAVACFSAGLPLAVAINGKTYRHPEHFAGLERAVLVLDSDDAGQSGRADLYLALTALGVDVLLLPAAALEGCNDLGEYWQRYGRMPADLAAVSIGPHMHSPRHNAAPLEPITPAADDAWPINSHSENQHAGDIWYSLEPGPFGPALDAGEPGTKPGTLDAEQTGDTWPLEPASDRDNPYDLPEPLYSEAIELARELWINADYREDFRQWLAADRPQDPELDPADRPACVFALELADAIAATSATPFDPPAGCPHAGGVCKTLGACPAYAATGACPLAAAYAATEHTAA